MSTEENSPSIIPSPFPQTSVRSNPRKDLAARDNCLLAKCVTQLCSHSSACYCLVQAIASKMDVKEKIPSSFSLKLNGERLMVQVVFESFSTNIAYQFSEH